MSSVYAIAGRRLHKYLISVWDNYKAEMGQGVKLMAYLTKYIRTVLAMHRYVKASVISLR